MKLETAEALRQARWVQDYRLAHRDADRWANSPSGIHHTIETQDHIFRMAEELRGRLDWPKTKLLFPVLKAVDDAASWETDAHDTPTPASAAAAGLVGYQVLFGKLPLDPVAFDGTDPAAYIWALFKVRQRAAAGDQAVAQPKAPLSVLHHAVKQPAGVAR